MPVTLKDSLYPLHDFLKYDPSKHIVCLQARDPGDGRDMPSNGKDYLSVRCVRGMRKVGPFIDVSIEHRAKPIAFISYVSLIGICMAPPHTLTLSSLFRTYLLHPHLIPKNASTSRWSGRLSGCSIFSPLYPRTRKIGPTCWFTWPEGLTPPLVKPSPKLSSKHSSGRKPIRSSR